MSNQEIVQKLWNLCNVLRDDGITYHQYVTELTYILFLKMMQETAQEQDISKNIIGLEELKEKQNKGEKLTKQEQGALSEKEIIVDYSWETLVSKDGIE
jgi:type I restriction enzyme M protein